MNRSLWSTGVVVPAQNEEDTIGECIDSIFVAHQHCARSLDIWLVVVADSCTDHTVDRARSALSGRGQVIECSVKSPGTARRVGAAAVLEHFKSTDLQNLWIANTDADTHVPPNWLAVHLARADDNASAVAGIVQLEGRGLRPDVAAHYERTYELRVDGTHPHVHGANFGVRGDAYLDVGGWSDVTVAEDHCLWGRLKQKGWILDLSSLSVVTTSGRLYGRAIGGFADRLRSEITNHT